MSSAICPLILVSKHGTWSAILKEQEADYIETNGAVASIFYWENGSQQSGTSI